TPLASYLPNVDASFGVYRAQLLSGYGLAKYESLRASPGSMDLNSKVCSCFGRSGYRSVMMEGNRNPFWSRWYCLNSISSLLGDIIRSWRTFWGTKFSSTKKV